MNSRLIQELKDLQYLIGGNEVQRVHFGNACKLCFSQFQVEPCVCEEVKYCCDLHRKKDRLDHEQLCKLLQTRTFPEDLSAEAFYERNLSFIETMKEYLNTNRLTHYQRELCMVPWVCIVCFTKKNLSYWCAMCRAVIYCSEEHKKKDAERHKLECEKIGSCRMFSSLGYERGFKMVPTKCKYIPIRPKQRHFPKDITGLMKIVQKQLRAPTLIAHIFSLGIFSDRFAPAGTILSILDSLNIITNRKYNWLPGKELVKVIDKSRAKNARDKYSGCLVIHFVVASDYELLQVKWGNLIGLFLDWIINVYSIKIILVGEDLSGCPLPDFGEMGDFVNCEMYPTQYKNVVDRLERPDVIVMFNIGYPKMNSFTELNDPDSLKSIFKHKDVPVIITTPFRAFFDQLFALPFMVNNVEKIKNVEVNQYNEFRCLRCFNRYGFECRHYNELSVVFKRKN